MYGRSKKQSKEEVKIIFFPRASKELLESAAPQFQQITAALISYVYFILLFSQITNDQQLLWIFYAIK